MNSPINTIISPDVLSLSHHFSHHFFPMASPFVGFTGDRGPKPWIWCPRRPVATRRTARSSSWTAQVGQFSPWWLDGGSDGGVRWLVCKGNEHNSWKYHWDMNWIWWIMISSELWENWPRMVVYGKFSQDGGFLMVGDNWGIPSSTPNHPSH